MSPFWKNVMDELQYQGMNLKTLSTVTGIPYTTITNGKNRENSIPTADVAFKISKVLHVNMEFLLGEDSKMPDEINPASSKSNPNDKKIYLLDKYERFLLALETCSPTVQQAFMRMAEDISKDTKE